MALNKRSLFVAVLLCLGLAISPAARAAALVGPDWATKLVIYNASNSDVPVMVSMGTSNVRDGCPTAASYIKVMDLAGSGALQSLTTFQQTSQGWFLLKRGQKAQLLNVGTNPYTNQKNYCLDNIKFGFGQIPTSCPDQFTSGALGTYFPETKPGKDFNKPKFVPIPNGSTGFECSLNEPFTGSGTPGGGGATTNEALDISCVNGANAKILVQIIPPARGPFWETNVGAAGGGALNGAGNTVFRAATSFSSSWVNVPAPSSQQPGCDDNCVDAKTGLARPGVYPYGCSQCNIFPDPCPPCGLPFGNPCYSGQANSQFCAAKSSIKGNNGCGFTRSPLVQQNVAPVPPSGSQKFGGTVQVTYQGPATPPTKCPK